MPLDTGPRAVVEPAPALTRPPLTWRALRVAFYVVILGLTVFAVIKAAPEIPAAMRALGDADPLFLGLALLLEVAALTVLPFPYRDGTRLIGGHASYRQARPAAMGAFALSRLLPGGGVAAGIYAAKRINEAGNDTATAALAVTVAGVMNMISLGVIVAGGAIGGIVRGRTSSQALWPALAVLAVLLAVLPVVKWALGREAVRVRLVRMIERLAGESVGLEWHAPLMRLAEHPISGTGIARIALWSTGAWILQVASLWACFMALGSNVPMSILILAFGAANLITALPHTPGGLGTVEAGMTATLVALGAAHGLETPVAVSGVLCFRVIAHWLPIAVFGVTMLRRREAVAT